MPKCPNVPRKKQTRKPVTPELKLLNKEVA